MRAVPVVGQALTALDVGQIAYGVGKLAYTNSQQEKTIKAGAEKNNASLEARKNEKNKAYYEAIQDSNRKVAEYTARSNSLWAKLKDKAAHAVGMASELDELKMAADVSEGIVKQQRDKYMAQKRAEAEAKKKAETTKLAAGSMEQGSTPTVQTPGAQTKVESMYNFTAELERIQEATFQGTKRALLDVEVQRKNEENAKLQGREINSRLVGR